MANFIKGFNFVPKFLLHSSFARLAKVHATTALGQVPKLVTWAVPAAVFGGWMIYPALTPSFKSSLSIFGDDSATSSVEYEYVEIDQAPQPK